MMQLTIKGQLVEIKNPPIALGEKLEFTATDKNLNIVTLNQFHKQFKLISSVPSIDTATCSLQTINFNKTTGNLKDLVTITISKDLPFAQTRFCKKMKINKNFHLWSDYRCEKTNFSNQTNLIINQNQLLARSVMILDKDNKVLYLQIVKEVSSEPNYDEVWKFLKTLPITN